MAMIYDDAPMIFFYLRFYIAEYAALFSFYRTPIAMPAFFTGHHRAAPRRPCGTQDGHHIISTFDAAEEAT